jgi:choline kinase
MAPALTSRSPREAIVLAAGNGDRFHQPSARSKLLASVGGVPLLTRTLVSAYHAGITRVHLVLGYDADRVAELARAAAPDGLSLHFHINRDWHRENGVSVLSVRECLHHRPFALLMGDHVFEAAALRRLLDAPRRPGETLLCVDRKPAMGAVAGEATRVRLTGGRVTAIGKGVEPYDALDTGLFVCDPSVFDALDDAGRDGDTTLSAGIRRLTALGHVWGVDIGDARWCDVDTIDDLARAEQVAAAEDGRPAWRFPPGEPVAAVNRSASPA